MNSTDITLVYCSLSNQRKSLRVWLFHWILKGISVQRMRIKQQSSDLLHVQWRYMKFRPWLGKRYWNRNAFFCDFSQFNNSICIFPNHGLDYSAILLYTRHLIPLNFYQHWDGVAHKFIEMVPVSNFHVQKVSWCSIIFIFDWSTSHHTRITGFSK